MTREEAGKRGREIAARARAQKREYYTDGNTVRHVKPQSRVANPYISKDRNKDKYNSRSEMRQPERNTSARKRIDFQIEKHRIEERKKQQKIEQQRQQKERRREKQQAKEQAFIDRERQQKAYFSGYNKQEQTERYTDAAWFRSVSYDCVNRRIVFMHSLPAAEIRADLQNADSSQPGIRA